MILVTGASGFLGKRLIKLLERKNHSYILTNKSRGLDLRDLNSTLDFFEKNRPDYVLNCAAYVGGIQFGYKHSAEMFDNNLRITLNLLKACSQFGVKRLVNPISNCSYPGEAEVFKEIEFWNGPLHDSVMVYGFVRKASWVGSWAYAKQYGLDSINIILPNVYGPEDHFDEERSHALGALIMKIANAKKHNLSEVVIWGSGKPVDDAAEAMVRSLFISSYEAPINIGVGRGISIIDMALLIKNIIGYEGDLVLDQSKPDGAYCKIMNGDLGKQIFKWQPSIKFQDGIKDTIEWYLSNGS
jgi:GDP-L-fucose synthase